MFKNKSHDKVNDYRAAESKKRKINEVHSNRCGFNAQLLSPPFTHPESFVLKPLYDFSYHINKYRKIKT
jgi:hypothetical protein